MPVIRSDEAETFEMHGSTFDSYVAPRTGSEQLCAWRLSVTPGSVGVAHRVSHEEILLITRGGLTVTVNDAERPVTEGDVVLVRTGDLLAVSGGPDGGQAWVTTSVGLHAVTADGERISPPWVR